MFDQDYSDDDIQQFYQRQIPGFIGEVLVNYTTRTSRAIVYRANSDDEMQQENIVFATPFMGQGQAAKQYIDDYLDKQDSRS